jgi:hypothetical protein
MRAVDGGQVIQRAAHLDGQGHRGQGIDCMLSHGQLTRDPSLAVVSQLYEPFPFGEQVRF